MARQSKVDLGWTAPTGGKVLIGTQTGSGGSKSVCHRAEITLPAEAAAPALARRWARTELADLYSRVNPAADDAELVVSELVTNAITAGAQRLQVAVEGHHTRVRVAVTDDAPGLPALRHAGATSPGGRGLLIIGALARRWGVAQDPGPGKTVWADLPAPIDAGPTFDCSDIGIPDTEASAVPTADNNDKAPAARTAGVRGRRARGGNGSTVNSRFSPAHRLSVL